METTYWQKKWERNEIAFHQSEANPHLVRHLNRLSLRQGDRVFVPLCGKTLDIHWLLANGFGVAGAELSESAVAQLFAELGMEPCISDEGEVRRYRATNIDILVGNLFAVSKEVLGPVDAVYDRAALVALPETMRGRYAAHLAEITERAPQLLICYEYDQTAMDGPPFSVSNEEIRRHYQGGYELTFVTSANAPGGLKARCAATENVWMLRSS